jgi:hypothetical protein
MINKLNEEIKKDIDNNILKQFEFFSNKFYVKDDIIKFFYEFNKSCKKFILIEIKNNKIIYSKKKGKKKFYEGYLRKNKLLLMLKKTLKRYKIKDTKFIIYIGDGSCYQNEIPTFSWNKPDNINTIFMPHYDFIESPYNNLNFDDLKKEFNNFNPKIINKIYFKGKNTSKRKSKIRSKMFLEKDIFDINIIDLNDNIKNNNNNNNYESIINLKKYKYLLDLPGVKPWSIRLKYLFLTKKFIIRISFYNSMKKEKSRWKQLLDIFLKPNRDYINLEYDIDNENEISEENYNKIKNDIIDTYNYYEKNPEEYKKIVDSASKNIKKLNMEAVYYYIYKSLNQYNKLFNKDYKKYVKYKKKYLKLKSDLNKN